MMGKSLLLRIAKRRRGFSEKLLKGTRLCIFIFTRQVFCLSIACLSLSILRISMEHTSAD